jgi:hypothetical protein
MAAPNMFVHAVYVASLAFEDSVETIRTRCCVSTRPGRHGARAEYRCPPRCSRRHRLDELEGPPRTGAQWPGAGQHWVRQPQTPEATRASTRLLKRPV